MQFVPAALTVMQSFLLRNGALEIEGLFRVAPSTKVGCVVIYSAPLFDDGRGGSCSSNTSSSGSSSSRSSSSRIIILVIRMMMMMMMLSPCSY